MNELVTITIRPDLGDALVTRSYLEAYGILVILPEERHVAMNWFVLQALQGIRVQVPMTQADEARALLKEVAPFELPVDPPVSAQVAAGLAILALMPIGLADPLLPLLRRWPRLFARKSPTERTP